MTICFVATLSWSRSASAQEPAESGAARGDGGPCSGSIDLHVVDSLMHEPVPAALVAANGVPVGMTDERGRLTLQGLCRGEVVLDVAALEHRKVRRVLALAESASLEIQLEPVFEEVSIQEKAVAPTDMQSRTVVSGEALEHKRGQSLSDAVADVPGVTQLRSGSGVAKPIVRGLFGRRLPMLVDGVRHRSQDWGLDHAPEIDPFVADRITVLRGASGVRYGSDAIGGVLLVDPPEPLRAPGFGAESHAVGFSNGLGGSLMARAQGVPAAAPGLSLEVEGSAKRLRAPATPNYPLDNTGETEWSAGATAVYRRGGDSYQLSLRHFGTELGVCSCYHIESADDFFAQLGRQRPKGAELYSSEARIERPYQKVAHELGLARGRWSAGRTGTVTATYALQYDDRREYEVVRQATTGPQFAFRLWTHDLDATFEHNPIHLTEHLHLSGSAGVVGMAQVHSYDGLPLVPDHRAVAAGAYAIERLWADSYELEAGVRYDFLTRSASLIRRDFLRLVRSGQLAEDACGTLGPDTDPVACASAYHTVSASLGGLVRFGSAWSARLDLSTASRPPNPDEQYINGTAPSFPVFGLGKPDLGSETSYSASLTGAYAGTRINAEVSAFGNFISDYIYFAPAIGSDGKPIFDVIIRGAFPRFVTRAVDAVFYGADGQINIAPVRWLDLGAQASAVRARNVSDGSYLVFIPPDRVRGSIAGSLPGFRGIDRAAASFAGAYVARQARFDLAADLAPPPPGYFLAEASLGVEAHVAGQLVKVALQGTNLLGARYREYTSLLRYFADQPGRQLMLRISLSYASPKHTP